MQADQHMVSEVEQTAAKFASRHIEQAAMDADHSDPRFPDEVFAHGIEAGFDRFVLPENAGGYGFQMSELCSLVKTLAQTCAGHAMVFGVHAAVIKSLFDSGGQHSGSLLEQIFSSGRPVAVTIPEPVSFNDFDTDLTASKQDSEHILLSGQAGLAINRAPSGFFVVFARNPDGHPLALLLQEKQETFGHGESELTLGLRAMPMAELTLDRHLVPRSSVIAQGDEAADFYRFLLGNLSLVASAAAAGLMSRAYSKALEYAAARYQGGKMIIDHSHLRAILGAMSAEAMASSGSVFHSATRPSDTLFALGTKVKVTQGAVKTCTNAVQVLGGYGYMRDYGLEKAMRDAAVLSLLPVSNARAELLITANEREKFSRPEEGGRRVGETDNTQQKAITPQRREAMSKEFFEGVKQWDVEFEGYKGKVPVYYYDNTSMTAIYTASAGKVKNLLPHPGMRPIELYPGRCLVAFTAFEYRKTDIDPYNEFSIAFLITFKKPQIPGVTATWQMVRRCFTAYVWQLPVTTEIARVGGVEMYGYPKFIADIDFQKEKGWVECALSEGGKNILTLKGRNLPTKKGKVTRFMTYSVKDGIPLKANIYVNPLEFVESRSRGAADLKIGTGHPICDQLEGIGLSDRPLVYQLSPITEAILFAGKNLMDN